MAEKQATGSARSTPAMGSSHNGHEQGNGHEQPPSEQPVRVGKQRIVEDGSSTTLDSGLAVCKFDNARGGRLESWQWHTIPPRERLQPSIIARVHKPLDLVDPQGGALIDHFLALGTKPAEFVAGEHREFGDFVEEPYRSQAVDSGGELRVGMLRDGSIRAGNRVAEVRMAKSAAIRPGAADIAALYRVINSSLRPLQILFAIEFNLFAPGLADKAAPVWKDGYYLIDGVRPDSGGLDSSGVSPACTHVALANPHGEMALQLGWDREADLWRMPPANGGAAARLLIIWRIQLPPRDNWAMGLWMAPS